jgi:hypothetical protein
MPNAKPELDDLTADECSSPATREIEHGAEPLGKAGHRMPKSSSAAAMALSSSSL